MLLNKRVRSQGGATMIEAMIAVPIILVACLLTLQLMLLYRAKIALNFATQESARVGAMSNGRVVPRFLTDPSQFATVIRRKTKCVNASGGVVPGSAGGGCPNGSLAEQVDASLPSGSVPGAGNATDGNEPKGPQFSSSNQTGGGQSAPNPPPLPTQADANAAKSGNEASVKSYAIALGKGMLRYGDSSTLQGFINGIAPLYTTGGDDVDVTRGQIDAYSDAMMNSCILYHSPTHAAFLDFGFMEVDGPDKNVLQIPNDLLRYRVPADVDPKGKHAGYFKANGKYLSDEEGGLRGQVSNMSIQEATLLSIEVKYSYPLKVPVAREILLGLARLRAWVSADTNKISDSFDGFSLNNGRWPMSGYATYRMQTPVHWNLFYPFGGSSAVHQKEIEGFRVIQSLWNVVSDKLNDSFDPYEPQIGFCPGLWVSQSRSTADQPPTNGSWFGKDYDVKFK